MMIQLVFKGFTPDVMVLAFIRKQAEETMGKSINNINSYCTFSYLNISSPFEFIAWLPSLMTSDEKV